MAATFRIYETNFSSCRATYGGALYINAPPIFQNCFEFGSASGDTSTCPTLKIWGDTYTFDNNSVSNGGGGAIYQTGGAKVLNLSCSSGFGPPDPHIPQLLQDSCTRWAGNTALGGFGPAVASAPISLSAPLLPDGLAGNYSSGTDLDVAIGVLDLYDQVVSSSDAQLKVYVSAVSEVASGQVGVAVDSGWANFTALKMRAPSGSYLLNFTFTSTQYLGDPATGGTSASIFIRPCHIGERTASTNDSCLSCDAGTFNFEPADTVCSGCPTGALCADPVNGGILVPIDGWWVDGLGRGSGTAGAGGGLATLCWGGGCLGLGRKGP